MVVIRGQKARSAVFALDDRRIHLDPVKRGLDPRIHLLKKMDCRIKSGNDDLNSHAQGPFQWP
jgi:hypothetical protein